MKFMQCIMPAAAAALLAICSLASCSNKDKEKLAQDEAINAATREELAQALNQRDELLQLVNEINDDMVRIKDIEGVLSSSVYMEGDMPTQREQLRADLASIQKTLKDHRDRLTVLEEKLRKSNLDNNNLTATINNLRQQIDEQAAEINTLTANLNEARTQIGQLSSAVDSLSNTVNAVTDARNQAEQRSENLINEMNTCYYACGSKKELKEHKIIETGFLRKTKIMKGEFEKDFFTMADKRKLTRLPLHAKKAKILTNQPSGSYKLEKEDGLMVLTISDPESFWSLSNYLVIEIDK